MARPKKQPAEQRDQRFNLRFTQAELEHVHAQAARAGLSAHEYARRRSLGHIVSPAAASRGADPALISELNRIGVNLNQLARATNMGKEFSGEWDDIALELRRVLNVVMASDGA